MSSKDVKFHQQYRAAVDAFRQFNLETYSAVSRRLKQEQDGRLLLNESTYLRASNAMDGFEVVYAPRDLLLGALCPYKHCDNYTGGSHMCQCFLEERRRLQVAKPAPTKSNVVMTEEEIKKLFITVAKRYIKDPVEEDMVKEEVVKLLKKSGWKLEDNVIMSVTPYTKLSNVLLTFEKGQFCICGEFGCYKPGLHYVKKLYVCSDHLKTGGVHYPNLIRQHFFMETLRLYMLVNRDAPADVNLDEKWIRLLSYLYVTKTETKTMPLASGETLKISLTKPVQLLLLKQGGRKKTVVSCIGRFCFRRPSTGKWKLAPKIYNQTDEKSLGHILCRFCIEKYGDGVYPDLIDKIVGSGVYNSSKAGLL